jgi:DNA-directed RNA polymerase subunit RPC12/RpoP
MRCAECSAPILFEPGHPATRDEPEQPPVYYCSACGTEIAVPAVSDSERLAAARIHVGTALYEVTKALRLQTQVEPIRLLSGAVDALEAAAAALGAGADVEGKGAFPP